MREKSKRLMMKTYLREREGVKTRATEGDLRVRERSETRIRQKEKNRDLTKKDE